FIKAGEIASPVAQFNLGIMYAKGQGVEKDVVEAYKWCSMAAAQGDPEARINARELAMDMSPEQLADGVKRATTYVAEHYEERQPANLQEELSQTELPVTPVYTNKIQETPTDSITTPLTNNAPNSTTTNQNAENP
ncbi:MAG: sel1 repeat family protein, partial [Verrucomicrobia bacterium]|nr:sel1 repeat family protein [Verrucomicrobiota bacterium]